jgi:hypothetical protein
MSKTINVKTVARQLPDNVTVRRGSRGHLRIEGGNLRYELDKSKFNSAEELAAYAASKIPVATVVTR